MSNGRDDIDKFALDDKEDQRRAAAKLNNDRLRLPLTVHYGEHASPHLIYVVWTDG